MTRGIFMGQLYIFGYGYDISCLETFLFLGVQGVKMTGVTDKSRARKFLNIK